MTYLQDKPAPPSNASHDSRPPQALLDFMMKEWRPAKAAALKPIKHAAHHARRRLALTAQFPGETLVIPTGHEVTRSNDTIYRFRPGSDFFYLTGNVEPDGVLVLRDAESHLFVEPNPGKANETFFTDRKKGELWVGPRLGVEQSRARYGVTHAHPLSELSSFVQASGSVRLLRGISAETERLAPARPEDSKLGEVLAEQRLYKDAAEVAELKHAIAMTLRGFEDVIRELPKHKTERQVEGVFALRARADGNDTGYGTIAAAGAHACILHWTHNDGALKKGELLLLDAGVEAKSLYTADITRTLPISGRFSPAQREIHQLVYDAQQAAFEACKPGLDFMEPNRRAMKVLAHGLQRLGILPDAENALRDDQQLYKRYSLHNVSHMLGLDVHDCAKARQEVYRFGALKPGMVLTIEPGLYFQPDDLTVPAKYRGIGVRLEDDVLITEKGFQNLSKAIPCAPDAIEAWIKQVWKKR